MNKRIFAGFWFGILTFIMSVIPLHLFSPGDDQFIFPSGVSLLSLFISMESFFAIPPLKSKVFEYLLILVFAMIGSLLADRLLPNQSKINFFRILGLGFMGGLLALLSLILLTLAVGSGTYDSWFRQNLAIYLLMNGWRIILLWTLFAIGFYGINKLFRRV